MILAPITLIALLSSAQSECADMDPFCRELKHAQSLETRWLELDQALHALDAALDRCDGRSQIALGRAQAAADEMFQAYTEYYRKWSEFAHDQSQLFARMADQHKISGEGIESLLASAEREYGNLVARRDVLQKAGRSVSADEIRILNSLIETDAQRVENFRKARSKWQEGADSGDSGRKAAMNLGLEILNSSRLSESERILWAAYYEGRELRLQLVCHDQSH